MDKDEVFMKYLYDMTNNVELCKSIMQIHDLVYGDGSVPLDVDPSYNDCKVEYEARPKSDSCVIYQEVNQASPNLGMDLAAMKEAYRSKVFDPLGDIERNRPKSELERLMSEPVEQNGMYKRW